MFMFTAAENAVPPVPLR